MTCFIVPCTHRHHGFRFWSLEWRGIGWIDLDVIWVAKQDPVRSTGFVWEQALYEAQLKTTREWTLSKEGWYNDLTLYALDIPSKVYSELQGPYVRLEYIATLPGVFICKPLAYLNWAKTCKMIQFIKRFLFLQARLQYWTLPPSVTGCDLTFL